MTTTHAEATHAAAARHTGEAATVLTELARFHEACEAVDVVVVGPSGAGEVAGL